MKPLHAEKTDLRTELRLLSFLFFLLIPLNLSIAQIPLNGFCKLNTYKIENGFNSIFSFNFNKDSYSDLIFTSRINKDALLMEGSDVAEFKPTKKIRTPHSITALEPIINRSNEIEAYAVLSRSERIFGIYSFSKYGQPSVIKQFRFNAYPDKISIADINADGQNVFLISGSTFDGLSLLKIQKSKIVEEKLFEKSSFSFANFVDLNNDGFKDVAAYNLITGQIHFLFNNGEGLFTEARKISYDGQITQFRTFDFNYDSFSDLIISSGNSINIYLGDFRASYDSTITISTLYSVDDFVIGDFNDDGYFDIIYLSKESGIVSTLFGRPDGSFYKEIVHLKREKIESIIPYISKFIFGVAFLTADGELGILSKLTSTEKDFNLAISIKPETIKSISPGNSKNLNFVFFDDWTNTLNILLSNSRGIPEKYFSAALFGKPGNVIVQENGSEYKFICYSIGSRLIEVLTIDLENNNLNREQIYSPGSLIDLKLLKEDDNNLSIYIIHKKGEKSHFGKFNYQNIRYSYSEYYAITQDWLNAEIIPFKKPSLLYWKTENGELGLIELSFNLERPSVKKRQDIQFEKAEIISSIVLDQKKNDYKQFSLIQTGERNFISVVSAENEMLINTDNQFSGLRIKNKNHLSFDGLNNVFFYDDNRKSFGKIELSKDHKRYKIHNLFDNIHAADFIVVNLGFNSKHLIYLNSENGLISARQIK